MADTRALSVIEDLEQTLIDFIRKHGITHEEYRAATDLIVAEVQAGEASLLFDVFLEAAATDVGNEGREGSIEAIEGPFYLPDAPWIDGPPYVMPMREDEPGTPLIFRGQVTSETGTPLSGVELDVWHADAAGEYSQIHPGVPDWNLRGRLRTDDQGYFEVRTIAPPPYEIPKDGPTGTALNALGRHFFRPAHLHLKLRHEYFGQRTSQLYFEGGEYLDSDVANAVRDELLLSPELVEDPEKIAAKGLTAPYIDTHCDFAFSPTSASASTPAHA